MLTGSFINWFDLAIVVFLVILIWHGVKRGFVTQFLLLLFFFGGLFVAGGLLPHILPIHDTTLLTIINGNLVLLFAIISAIAGYHISSYIHIELNKNSLQRLEDVLNFVMSLTFGLIAVWLFASSLGRLPFEGLSNSASDSFIVQLLDNHLPPIPAVFAEFNKQLNPNKTPQIFIRTPFQTESYVPLPSNVPYKVAANDAESVVRITGFGCGGLVTGSGTVIAPDLIITNAHVVAGVHRPVVKFGSQSYSATPVLFDLNLDLAALRVQNMHAKVLSFYNGEVKTDTGVVVIGYPGGNYTMLPGVVLGEAQLLTSNLYGVGSVVRQVYEIKDSIESGSSGSPIILPNGQSGGIVFAQTAPSSNYAYALTSKSLLGSIHQAERSTQRVNTGVCVTG